MKNKQLRKKAFILPQTLETVMEQQNLKNKQRSKRSSKKSHRDHSERLMLDYP